MKQWANETFCIQVMMFYVDENYLFLSPSFCKQTNWGYVNFLMKLILNKSFVFLCFGNSTTFRFSFSSFVLIRYGFAFSPKNLSMFLSTSTFVNGGTPWHCWLIDFYLSFAGCAFLTFINPDSAATVASGLHEKPSLTGVSEPNGSPTECTRCLLCFSMWNVVNVIRSLCSLDVYLIIYIYSNNRVKCFIVPNNFTINPNSVRYYEQSIGTGVVNVFHNKLKPYTQYLTPLMSAKHIVHLYIKVCQVR